MVLQVSLANTYKPVIDAVMASVGGGMVCYDKRTSAKTGERQINPKLTLWSWYLAGPRAAEFLQKVYPYLIIKKEQALLGLKFQETVLPRGNFSSGRPVLTDNVIAIREELRLQLQVLKRVNFPSTPVKNLDGDSLLDELVAS